MAKDANSTDKTRGFDTVLTHSGYNPRDYHGFVNPPVVHASTVLFPDTETMLNRSQKYLYGTRGTPTTDALCDVLSELEGAAGTILVPSGLAAVTVPLLAFAKAGDHVLIIDNCYGPTRHFCDTVLIRLGVEVEYFDPLIGTGLQGLLRPNTSVVFLEAPGSGSFDMCDTPLLAGLAKQAGAVVMMDNTWATPLFFKPLEHGVDLSIHALTKYPAGHSDLVLGSVSANAETYHQLHETFGAIGACPAPDDTYLVFRSMKTMGVRLRHHQDSALAVARWLKGRDDVARVLHPALEDDPGHAIWKRDFKGSSGLFGVVLKDRTRKDACRFLDALRLFGLGYSWGGFESLAVLPGFSDRAVTVAPVGGTTIRLHIGLENVEDLIADLERGFAALNQ